MEWENNDSYLYGHTTNNNINNNKKLAMFDLDGTIIKVKSGNKFPIDENDWIFFNDNVKPKLNEYYNKNYNIIIITNQMGISKNKQDINEFKTKIENIQKELDIPLKIYISKKNDIYRKPFPTFYNLINIKSKYNFYCGDAAGRKNDFNDTDYKFALNNKINFYTPEEIFDTNIKKIKQKISVNYPVNLEELKELNNNNEIVINFKEKIMIIMVGCPASGKSYITNKLMENNYVSINQDKLKTKNKCIKEVIKNIKENKNIIIDNTNPTKETRKIYIDIAKEYNYKIVCININCNKELGIHNNYYRSYITNGDINIIPTLVYNIYFKKYEEPTLDEKFDEIKEINFTPPKDDNYYMYFY
jgi:bifunctional polynucleotide phosphatase/kinase